jgi:hypothetical protein
LNQLGNGLEEGGVVVEALEDEQPGDNEGE